MDWSIQQLAKLTGTTSRTLRHYDDIGLLAPTRVASNGYRHYNEDALVRLQRILLLRQLGLGLLQIADVLAQEVPEERALRAHLEILTAERDRVERQIAAVQRTIQARTEGKTLMAEQALDGFDHSQHREEVEQRWGKDAARAADTWWREMTDTARGDWKAAVGQLNAAWIDAAAAGSAPDSAQAQTLAERHVAWLRATPGTPAANGGDLHGYLLGLGEMYVSDARFAANYGGVAGATFVRDALRAYVHANRE